MSAACPNLSAGHNSDIKPPFRTPADSLGHPRGHHGSEWVVVSGQTRGDDAAGTKASPPHPPAPTSPSREPTAPRRASRPPMRHPAPTALRRDARVPYIFLTIVPSPPPVKPRLPVHLRIRNTRPASPRCHCLGNSSCTTGRANDGAVDSNPAFVIAMQPHALYAAVMTRYPTL